MKLLSLAALLICPSVVLAAAPPSTLEQSASVPEGAEIVCKRFAEPGSVIKKRKICLTRMQWSQLSESAQRNVEHLQFNNMGGADGCKPGAPGC